MNRSELIVFVCFSYNIDEVIYLINLYYVIIIDYSILFFNHVFYLNKKY